MVGNNIKKKPALRGRLKIQWKHLPRIFSETYRIFNASEMNIISGYTTFYILMALVPFLTLAAGSVNMIREEYLNEFRPLFVDLFMHLFPNIPQIQSLVNDLIDLVNPQTGTVLISVSLVTILWSVSNAVSALQLGLRRVSGTRQSAIQRRVSALVYTILFIFLLPALLIFRLLRSLFLDMGVWLSEVFRMPEITNAFGSVLKDGGLITAIAIAFIVVLTYTYLQGKTYSFRVQLPGAVFTTVLWLLFSEIFEWFIVRFWTMSSLYGSLASIFLTALWMKTIITILFLGACLNEAVFRISGSLGRTS